MASSICTRISARARALVLAVLLAAAAVQLRLSRRGAHMLTHVPEPAAGAQAHVNRHGAGANAKFDSSSAAHTAALFMATAPAADGTPVLHMVSHPRFAKVAYVYWPRGRHHASNLQVKCLRRLMMLNRGACALHS